MKLLSEKTTVLFVLSTAAAACKRRAADVVGNGSTRGTEGPAATQTFEPGTES